MSCAHDVCQSYSSHVDQQLVDWLASVWCGAGTICPAAVFDALLCPPFHVLLCFGCVQPVHTVCLVCQACVLVDNTACVWVSLDSC